MPILQGYGTSTLPLTLDVTPEMLSTTRADRPGFRAAAAGGLHASDRGLYQAAAPGDRRGEARRLRLVARCARSRVYRAGCPGGTVGVAAQKLDIGGLLPEGSKVENISIKAPEDAEDKAAAPPGIPVIRR